MKNLKAKVLTGFIVIIMFSFTCIPVFAASEAFYSFEMSYGYVNGDYNNQYHSLSSGKAKIDAYSTHTNISPGIDERNVYYTLKRKSFLGHKDFGTVNAGISTSITGSFSTSCDVQSDKYYLIIWKPMVNGNRDDGWKVTGNGKIYN